MMITGLVTGACFALGFILGKFVEKYRSMQSAIEVLSRSKNLALIDKDFEAPPRGEMH